MGSTRTIGLALAATTFSVTGGPTSTVAAPSCAGEKATIYEPSKLWVRGTDGDDVIVGGGTNFTIRAQGGDDLICQAGGRHIDLLHGGSGKDRVVDARRVATLEGGRGDDVLRAGPYNSAHGGVGNDLLRGGKALSGGRGHDVLIQGAGYPGLAWLSGGPGRDVIDSRAGAGHVTFYDAPKGVRVRLDRGWARGEGTDRLVAVENVTGSDHDDVLVGSDVVGRPASDMFGRSNDLFGNDGDDVLRGLAGDDFLHGDFGHDSVSGGGGEDELHGGGFWGGEDGVDALRGGPGNDELSAYSNAGDEEGDSLWGGKGDDGLLGDWADDLLDGGPGDDDIRGWRGRDAFAGGPGDDVLRVLDPFSSLTGGPGFDSVSFRYLGPVRADLRDQTARVHGSLLQFSGVEGFWGSIYGDELIGDDGANLLYDGANSQSDGQTDVIVAGAGDDVVSVTADHDDRALGESFRVEGGDGSDSLTFAIAGAGATADLTAGTAAVGSSPGTVSGFENLFGGRHDDTLWGDGSANEVSGLDGDDSLFGRAGDDLLDGGGGEDSADGGDGADECSAEEKVSCEDAERAAPLPFLIRMLLGLV